MYMISNVELPGPGPSISSGTGATAGTGNGNYGPRDSYFGAFGPQKTITGPNRVRQGGRPSSELRRTDVASEGQAGQKRACV